MDFSDLGKLGDLAKQMQNAYGEGMDAANQVGKQATVDMSPDHEIHLDIKLSAKIEGHEYEVESKIVFEIELEPVLQSAQSPMGDLSSLLDGLGVDMGDDKDAMMEQLGQPRAIGRVKKINTSKLSLSNKSGKVDTDLNKKGTILATISDTKISFNCESTLSFPDHTDVFVAIPSMEKMQENLSIDLENIEKEIKFSWTEKDKDNLRVSGTLQIKEI